MREIVTSTFLNEADSYADALRATLDELGVEIETPDVSQERKLGADQFDCMVTIDCDDEDWLDNAAPRNDRRRRKAHSRRHSVLGRQDPRGLGEHSHYLPDGNRIAGR